MSTSARTNRLLAPYAAGLALLVLAPALLSFGFAFFRYNLVQSPTFVGLQNFSDLLASDIFRTSLRVSLLFLLFAVPLRAIGAIGLGLLYHRRMRGGSVYRSAVLLPVVMPDVAYALVWIWILNPFYGPLNVALRAIGVDPPLWLTTPGTAQMAVIMMVVFQLGEGFLIALAARQMVPPELYEIAESEGASSMRSFTWITFPLMLPALLLLAFRDTILALQASFVPSLIVTHGGPAPASTTYLPLFIYRNAFTYLRYGYASAATVVMLVVSAAIIWLQYRVVVRWRRGLRVA